MGCPALARGLLTSVKKRTDWAKLGLVWKSLMGSVCRASSQHSTSSWGERTCFMFRSPQTRTCQRGRGDSPSVGGSVLAVMVHQGARRARGQCLSSAWILLPPEGEALWPL